MKTHGGVEVTQNACLTLALGDKKFVCQKKRYDGDSIS